MAAAIDLGTCLILDGSTQEVTIPNSSAYSIPTTGALTVSIWVRPDADPMTNFASSGYVNFFNKDEPGGSFHEWCFRYYNTSNTETNLRQNEQDFYIFSAAGGLGASAISQASQYYFGRWIHYLATIDDTYAVLYINGQPFSYIGALANYITYPVTPAATTAILRVGRSTNNASYFKGAIGPIKIWSRKLSLPEIQAQYLTNVTNTTNLTGSWTADQANNRLTDSVSANHGTLINAPTFVTGPTGSRGIGSIPRRQPYSPPISVLDGVTQYFSISNASQTGLTPGTGDYMICFKVKMSNNANRQSFISKYDTGHNAPNSAGAIGFDVVYNQLTQKLSFRRGDGTGTTSNSCDVASLFDGGVHDIAVVSARSTGVAQIWVDGIKMVNGNDTAVTLTQDNNGAFVIGTNGDASSQFLQGSIGNVYFYKWATIPTDYFRIIEDLHYMGNTTYTTGLVSKWLLNGNANDSVGANNLTATASPTYVAAESRTATPSRAATPSRSA